MSRFNYNKRWLAFIGAIITFVLGAVGFAFCSAHHICMGGHMQHGPYPWWHYAVDVAWITTWLSSAGLLFAAGRRASFTARLVTALVLCLLLIGYWRFLLVYGSRHGWPLDPRSAADAGIAWRLPGEHHWPRAADSVHYPPNARFL